MTGPSHKDIWSTIIPHISGWDGHGRCPNYFVQIGGHDGRAFDPLYEMMKTACWPGCIVEPIPYSFDALTKLYRGRPNITLVQAAITTFCGTTKMKTINAEGRKVLPSWMAGSSCLSSEGRNLMGGRRCTQQSLDKMAPYVEELDVPCITWETLCEQLALVKCDLIQIDAEGHDVTILKDIFPTLDHLGVRAVGFETNFCTPEEEEWFMDAFADWTWVPSDLDVVFYR